MLALPLAGLFPALWAAAPNRLVAGLVALGYFLAASRGLPIGVANYYGSDIWLGFGQWFAASFLFVLVHGVLWTSKPGWHKPLHYSLAWILLSIPPFGITGWANPITAAGVLFPGAGWLGLIAMAQILSAMTTRAGSVVAIVAGAVFAWNASNWQEPKAPEGWVGIDTHFEYASAGQYADYAQQVATLELIHDAAKSGARNVVLPESAFGIWTPTTEYFWTRGLRNLDVTVNGGAVVVGADGYDNVMMEVSGEGARVVYRERMPVPVSMWRPWEGGGASAQFLGNPTGRFAGASIAPLICYEQLIVWPILQSMLFDPGVIVATGNGWWTGGTNIIAIQKASAEVWASLFGLRLVIAFNT